MLEASSRSNGSDVMVYSKQATPNIFLRIKEVYVEACRAFAPAGILWLHYVESDPLAD
jgi:hypothetical protein